MILDLGLPLTAGFDAKPVLPSIPGLATGESSLLGIVVSHGHPDHWGLVPHAHPDVPVFLGQATQRILREAAFFSPAGAELQAAGFLRDRQSFSLGPFTVTPFLADHSAFDAYSILVEAGGRRLFYSGDMRGHGRKSSLFERLLRDPPCSVNVLLLEGTYVRREPPSRSLSEEGLQDELARVFRATAGLALACYSGQNIDRLVTMFKAAKQSRRKLVLDLYTATMARATGNARIPQADWNNVRVFVPLSQRIRVRKSGEFDRTAAVRGSRIYPEQLAEQAGELVLTFRESMKGDLERVCLDDAHCVWSMWPGYLNETSGIRMRSWLSARRIPVTVLHSSGHASLKDLQCLGTAMNADRITPIHTSEPDLYQELFLNVERRSDGEWWRV